MQHAFWHHHHRLRLVLTSSPRESVGRSSSSNEAASDILLFQVGRETWKARYVPPTGGWHGMLFLFLSFSPLFSLLSSRPVSTNTEQKSFNTSEKKNSSLSGGSSSHVFSKNYFSTPVDALAHDTTKTKTKTTTIYVYTSVNKYIDIRVCGLEKTTKLGGTTQHTHTQSVD